MKKKLISIAVAILVITAAVIYFLANRTTKDTYKTARAERGQLASSVSATGNLAAVVTVSVGTQVSGTIQKLYVDFNSPVKKGQAIAQIDPALLEAAVEQARGNYFSAVNNLAKAKVAAADSKRTMERNRQLIKQGVVAQSDFDTALANYEQNAAQVNVAEATIRQTRGAMKQAETNLRYTTIRSPVNGIVVSRNVDVGQTVAASFQTPTLFTIAQDLTKMEIDTSIDESDIGRLKVGQIANFTVDAYPDRQFKGVIRQIRNAPVVTQNVVTYVTVIDVDNKDLLLKPGMTANVNIETIKKDNVLMVPNAALRFKPRTDKANSGKQPRKAVDKEVEKTKKEGQHIYLLNSYGKPTPVMIKTGISNDRFTEVLEGELKEGDEVITEQLQGKKQQTSGNRPPMGPRF